MIQQEDEGLDASQNVSNSPKKLSQVMHRSTRKANAASMDAGNGNNDFDAKEAFPDYEDDIE